MFNSFSQGFKVVAVLMAISRPAITRIYRAGHTFGQPSFHKAMRAEHQGTDLRWVGQEKRGFGNKNLVAKYLNKNLVNARVPAGLEGEAKRCLCSEGRPGNDTSLYKMPLSMVSLEFPPPSDGSSVVHHKGIKVSLPQLHKQGNSESKLDGHKSKKDWRKGEKRGNETAFWKSPNLNKTRANTGADFNSTFVDIAEDGAYGYSYIGSDSRDNSTELFPDS